MNNDIKYKLANAMKECMFSSPVEKITVKEICDTCGVTRQTFYRNFQKLTGITPKKYKESRESWKTDPTK